MEQLIHINNFTFLLCQTSVINIRRTCKYNKKIQMNNLKLYFDKKILSKINEKQLRKLTLKNIPLYIESNFISDILYANKHLTYLKLFGINVESYSNQTHLSKDIKKTNLKTLMMVNIKNHNVYNFDKKNTIHFEIPFSPHLENLILPDIFCKHCLKNILSKTGFKLKCLKLNYYSLINDFFLRDFVNHINLAKVDLTIYLYGFTFSSNVKHYEKYFKTVKLINI